MPYLPNEHELAERVVAAAELVERTGARHFKIGFLVDGKPAEEAQWYAYAQYQGTRISADNHRGPAEAAEALAVRLLTGAKCKCGKLVSLSVGGATAFHNPIMSDGSTFTIEEAKRVGQCRWKREGEHWVSSCGRRGRQS